MTSHVDNYIAANFFDMQRNKQNGLQEIKTYREKLLPLHKAGEQEASTRRPESADLQVQVHLSLIELGYTEPYHVKTTISEFKDFIVYWRVTQTPNGS